MRNTIELRGAILVAARAEFARYGLAGARIDRVARTAQASKERLYAHFGDKETLFREVVAVGNAEFFGAVTLRPDAVPNFVGEIFDLARVHPEHHRMITWAQLEGITLDEPHADSEPVIAHHAAAIREAQSQGHVDTAWHPVDLLVMLLALGLAWAQTPHPDATTDDATLVARHRAAAVEAASRVISSRP
ncbi:TetR family transcriptional regulator [Nocardia sp. NPDC055165]